MKRKKAIKVLIWIPAIICVCYLICISFRIIGYLNGVENDVIQNLKLAKEFFVKYSFSGKILDREFCNKGNDTFYSILIKLDSSVELPSFPYEWCYDEYNFDIKNRILKMKVSKDIYEKSNANSVVLKPSTSDSISIDGRYYLLLGQSDREWIPNRKK